MSKVPKLYSMCLRKKVLSEDIANKIINRAKNEGVILYKYLCPYCGKYHLTKKQPRTMENIKCK